jgi:hypothetical protein
MCRRTALPGQSKWVSEKLIMMASSRGVPATIFRPGYITGDSHTGGMSANCFPYHQPVGRKRLAIVPSSLSTRCLHASSGAATLHAGLKSPITHLARLLNGSTPKMRTFRLLNDIRSFYLGALVPTSMTVASSGYLKEYFGACRRRPIHHNYTILLMVGYS